jgi:hypothetical protein
MIELFILGFAASIRNIFTKRSISLEGWFLFVFIFSFLISIAYADLPDWFLKLLLFNKGFSRFPFRLYSLVIFSAAFFIAKGLDYFRNAHHRRKKITDWFFASVLFLGILFLSLRIVLHRPVLGGEVFFLFHNIVIFLSLVCFLIAYFKPKYSYLFVFFIIWDLLIVGYVYCDNRFQAYGLAKQDLYKHSFLRVQDQGWISQLPKRRMPYRVLIVSPNTYGEEGEINLETGYFYHKLRHPFGYCGSTSIYRLNKFRDIEDHKHPIFDILGVDFFYVKQRKQELTSDATKLLANQNALPLISTTNKARLFNDNQQMVETLYKGKDEAGSVVYLSNDDLGEDAKLFAEFINNAPQEPLAVNIDSISYNSSEVDFSFVTPSNIIVTLSEPWLPFWKAYIDGRETKYYQAYGIIQAIFLPAGLHRVRFVYTFPMHLIFISIISQMVLIAFSAIYLRKQK